MKEIYRIKPLVNNIFIKALSINDEPPLLVDLMESKINYNNPNPVSVEELPKYFRKYLFDFDYPLANEYKEDFEITFLENFIDRRIGYETYTAFKIKLKVKLKEIMPKYNKMLEGFSKLDFLGSQEKHIRAEEENGTSKGKTTNDNRFSSLPQNEIEDVKNGTYLTDYTYNESNLDNEANRKTNEDITISKVDSNDEYKKYLNVANNIYSDIFKELECLFFQVV